MVRLTGIWSHGISVSYAVADTPPQAVRHNGGSLPIMLLTGWLTQTVFPYPVPLGTRSWGQCEPPFLMGSLWQSEEFSTKPLPLPMFMFVNLFVGRYINTQSQSHRLSWLVGFFIIKKAGLEALPIFEADNFGAGNDLALWPLDKLGFRAGSPSRSLVIGSRDFESLTRGFNAHKRWVSNFKNAKQSRKPCLYI